MEQDARQRAMDLATETMGELVDFWGFKASTGRIWTLLYLSPGPLTADEVGDALGLSAGAVSMGISELMDLGLVTRAPNAQARKRHYQAETDIWGIIRRIVRQRELPLVGRASKRFAEAVELLEQAIAAGDDSDHTRFALERLRGLLDLARMGYTLVKNLADLGSFSLKPLRGILSLAGKKSA